MSDQEGDGHRDHLEADDILREDIEETDFHVTGAQMAKHNTSADSASSTWLAGSQVSEHQTSGLPVSDGFPTSYLTDEDRIVVACSAPDRQLLSDPEYCSLIVKYSESCVVEVGNVSVSEARNQQLAHKILDPSIVRVPEVYHYFTRDHEGYLSGIRAGMEKIAAAVRHLWSQRIDLPTQEPGPIGGGETRGMLWENEEIEIEGLEDLEKYWNDRLLDQMEPVHFESSQLSFVHCDIAPRNIIWSEDGIPVLLDWAHAGIYPRSFERAALHLNTQQDTEVDFSDSVAELLPLSEEEEAQVQKVLLGWFNGHRFYIRSRPIVQHSGPPPRGREGNHEVSVELHNLTPPDVPRRPDPLEYG